MSREQRHLLTQFEGLRIFSGPYHLAPWRLAALISAFGFLIMAIPPDAYEAALDEPDLMFGHVGAHSLVLLCLGAFIIGCLGTSALAAPESPSKSTKRGLLLAIGVSILGAILSVTAAASLLRGGLSAIQAIFSGEGDLVRDYIEAVATEGTFSFFNVLPIVSAGLLWSTDRYLTARPEAIALKNKLRNCLWASTGIFIVSLILTTQRNLLIPFILGILIIYSSRKWHPRGIALHKLAPFLGSLVAALIGLFLLMAFFRGGSSVDLMHLLFGYVPSSFNRLSAVVDGQLTSPNPGLGYYSLRLLFYPPVIRRFIPIDELVREYLGAPLPQSTLEDLLMQAVHVADAGLLPGFIWPTAYGYAFYDFGWLAPLYFAALGAFATFSWRAFLKGPSWASVLYPTLGASILLWPTDNFASYPNMIVYMAVGAILTWLERVEL